MSVSILDVQLTGLKQQQMRQCRLGRRLQRRDEVSRIEIAGTVHALIHIKICLCVKCKFSMNAAIPVQLRLRRSRGGNGTPFNSSLAIRTLGSRSCHSRRSHSGRFYPCALNVLILPALPRPPLPCPSRPAKGLRSLSQTLGFECPGGAGRSPGDAPLWPRHLWAFRPRRAPAGR